MYRDSDFTPHEANNHLRLGIADARRHLGLTPKSSFHRELPSTVVLCALWAGVTIPRESVLEFQATGRTLRRSWSAQFGDAQSLLLFLGIQANRCYKLLQQGGEPW